MRRGAVAVKRTFANRLLPVPGRVNQRVTRRGKSGRRAPAMRR
jgi:hypothetical protein